MSSNHQIAGKFPRKFGNYHLLAPLATGGMGALYLAVMGDRGLERLLVIKTVLPHLADAEYVARFRDEAKVVVKLSHGNLIPVFDAGQVGGECFLAMEFVEGRDLRAVWNRCAKKQIAFPVEVAVYIVKELCRGLAYAHAFGNLKLVHRDVSPPNILISFSGEVKLTDFGLASSTLKLEKTAPGIIYGKVAYMSPEQARGEPLDGRSDLYAAAIVLWELLTGRQLFPPGKDQPQDLIKRARNPQVQPPSSRAPRVPRALDEICLRALAPRREDRYANGEEFRQALTEWLATESTHTDAARLESFLHSLFSEDIAREQGEREQQLEQIRNRVRTMPPTDELRQALERSSAIDKQIKRSPGSVGRRATDHGQDTHDRRQGQERRQGANGKNRMTNPGAGPMRAPSSQSSAELATPLQNTASVPPRDFIGSVIDGRYRINELIGEGGMGRVYKSEHVEIGRQVAVKILHPVYSHMPDLVERFRREARAASRIGHPHIVDVTDSGTTHGSVYFVMEYLDGVDLGTVLEREGPIDVNRALYIASQMCRALAAAHAAGIIHRDLKPENIFLTVRDNSSDFVKVLDFGIAKSNEAERARARRLTSPGMAMGTPEYMAPEQAAGKPADERCDIYSVGAILYETLTGSPPYDGDNFMEVLTKKATSDPVPVRKVRPDIPDNVEALVLRAMARDSRERPVSMEVFEYEINKCLTGRGAAVAKILGMNPNQELVDSLNPNPAVRGNGAAAGAQGQGRPRRVSLPPPSMAAPMAAVEDPPPAASARSDEEVTLDVDLSEPASAMRMHPRWAIAAWVGAAVAAILVAGVVLYGMTDEGTAAVATAPQSPPAASGVPVASGVLDHGAVPPANHAAGRPRSNNIPNNVPDTVPGNVPNNGAAPGLSAGATPGPSSGSTPGPASNTGTPNAASNSRPGTTPNTAAGTAQGTAGSAPAATDVAAANTAPVAANNNDFAIDPEQIEIDPPDTSANTQNTTANPNTSSDAASSAAAKSPRPKPRRPSSRQSSGGRNALSKDKAQELLKKADGLAKTNPKRAIQMYREVTRSGHFRNQSQLGMAEASFQLGDLDAIIRYASKARGWRADLLLARAYFKKKDMPRARRHYEAVLKRNPNNQEAQSVLRRLGN